ncbi:benzoate/H(+) symporter BenE family transporter [Rouxiella badensis]|uniref:benzoate/H(+) symporter BenE family transporter n=1 Tax=Rouxiella badensis TaxID=1646377 RepID=UPI001D1563B0|nr:benzoate/H(+) symporter BenE family transporter [Rouxiella badensis]MCC3720206.1 benzoate/H(+) symporter BenE family transporter [Rouxiella badensis]MCC3729869.1 benzoate/H(+) symporter BenE family transporter [Rouxiella badensis]MCC3733948.1 benzoate/H(+) symporter BenE family transporter [Rouxiella badensis]MCC3741356.1 benzoate/H(+) symporter BenE family transporter [Rouxiella badensis]MCC3759440.1 benzoate/H(+) symporter BenE family transporter [Rouxiella badensis]
MLFKNRLQDWSFSAVIAGFVAVLVGYTSSAAIVFQAAEAAGANLAQIGSWFTMLGFGMGVTGIALSLYYRTPIVTAWSTPGAALLVTSLPGTSLNDAIGVFVFASGLILLSGVTGLFAKMMRYIPQALSAAMLAGILLRFGLDAFVSLQTNLLLAGGMCLTYLIARRLIARYSVILSLCVGLAIAAWQGDIAFHGQAVHFAAPEFIMPHFSWEKLVGIGLPFFVVSMASQNAPGIATLHASGFKVPVSPLITVTALLALILAPFGVYSIGIAAITAAICMGKDVHPDPNKRYTAAVAAGVFYLLAGVMGGSIGTLFTALPAPLIHTVAGLALLGTISGSLYRALTEEKQRDAAIVTFLITASGIQLFGVGSAFWGLIGGVLTHGILSLPEKKSGKNQ